MAQNGRVIPDCVYASNPYHECTEACLRKIKETEPQKNKKSSGVIHLKFGRKKKLGSKPERPVCDSVPTSKVGAIYVKDSSSPVSRYSEKKRVEPKSNEQISSGPVTLEEHFRDKPVYHKDQPNEDVEHFANHTQTNQVDEKNASDKVVPNANVDDTGEGLFTTSPGRSMDFIFSGVTVGNEDSEEETESLVSESRVPVGRYHVKESFAPILRSIFDKYGDIVASCHLESAVMRSYYVECVCFVVQALQSTSVMQLTKSKVKELLAILKDVESAQLNVAWLRTILNEIVEYTERINQHRAVEMAKAESEREVESLRKELESEMETLGQKEEEAAAIRTRIAETRDRLRELELKSSELDKSMSLIKSKVDNVDRKSLIDELL